MKIALFAPTYNAGSRWQPWLVAAAEQTLLPNRRLIIDSSSSDHTPSLARQYGWQVMSIPQSQFDHGGTRQQGIEQLSEMDVVVFLTQDALLADPGAVAELVSVFADPKVGSAYGRQLPHADATEAAARHRAFNYPDQDARYSLSDLQQQGLRAAFASDSFAAYRVSAVNAVGGFSTRVIFGEDMQLVVRLLEAGWQHAYCSQARVYHSHNYSYAQELSRYFDMGVFHQTHHALLGRFKGPGAEAKKLVLAELLGYCKCANVVGLLDCVLRNSARMTGYALSKIHRYLPKPVLLRLSMNRAYWRALWA